MIRFTVAWEENTKNQLADIWMEAANRRAITEAGDEIDRELASDAHRKGVDLGEGLRLFPSGPLVVFYTVVLEDRMVKVIAIRNRT